MSKNLTFPNHLQLSGSAPGCVTVRSTVEERRFSAASTPLHENRALAPVELRPYARRPPPTNKDISPDSRLTVPEQDSCKCIRDAVQSPPNPERDDHGERSAPPLWLRKLLNYQISQLLNFFESLRRRVPHFSRGLCARSGEVRARTCIGKAAQETFPKNPRNPRSSAEKNFVREDDVCRPHTSLNLNGCPISRAPFAREGLP